VSTLYSEERRGETVNVTWDTEREREREKEGEEGKLTG
jgi:hypothetical protein